MGFAPPNSRQKGESVDTMISQILHGTNAPALPVQNPDYASLDNQGISLSDGFLVAPDEWPAEIVDSMAWSSQFFNNADNA